MLAELLAHPGVEEVCELRGTFGLLAPHGGNLEQGTDVLASRAADRAGASLYLVRQPPDLYWHVPSVAFDTEASASLAAFIGHVDVVVAVHGYGRVDMWTTLLVGGQNRELASRLGAGLRASLGGGFAVVDDLEVIPPELRGLHPRNPVNLPRRRGAQLELPPRVRSGTGAPTYRREYEDAVVDALVDVATATMS
ncbi:MAG TPA: poly-gamma-glutamate hydrolase family protein, partial [Acidimicrobiales bacterium]|nr:poly-gamma-glutamate hydrolase family protein [Acidimicrobiales bacterium]